MTRAYMPPPEAALFREYERTRERFIASHEGNACEAADDAGEVEDLGDDLVEFARLAERKIGGTVRDHIEVFCDALECGSFLKACAMLRLHRVEAVKMGEAA